MCDHSLIHRFSEYEKLRVWEASEKVFKKYFKASKCLSAIFIDMLYWSSPQISSIQAMQYMGLGTQRYGTGANWTLIHTDLNTSQVSRVLSVFIAIVIMIVL